MSSYYYLLSSLPGLSFDSVPMDWDKFLEGCNGNVSEKEYSILKKLSLDSCEGNTFLEKWGFFYGSLKNELTMRRKKRAGETVKSETSLSTDTIQAINMAMENKNPLEAELGLLRFCFNYLETETSLSMFDQNSLMGYALKLRILERKAVFDQLEGQTEFRKLFSNLQSVIKSV